MTQSNPDPDNKTKLATNPYANIAVFASAGSGKTYLLVHRILKLLLSGVEPSHILAITFTRKAAAEMQERLIKVLKEWATADDSQVKITLQNLSHPHDGASIAKARKLYEELLFADYEIRITTFHAFCQDILKRFAIHAGVPAGFRVAENNEELKQVARKQLLKRAKHEKNNQLSNSLLKLLEHCNSVNNVNQVLDTFINSRSDWWIFTESQQNSVEFAEQCLHKLIFTEQFEKKKPVNYLISLLKEYLLYLSKHTADKYQNYCQLIANFLAINTPDQASFFLLNEVFFTKNMQIRKFKPSKALVKILGSHNTEKMLTLHETIREELLLHLDFYKKERLFEFNQAWFYAGNQLLEEYQSVKFNQNILDFDDLEWYTHLLLNQNDNAAWVQYKLDQRIQHILIDEFQDTNPTQWNLLLPLLTELALDANENHRSLFFVGDAKQSIYGFRRADSRLQFTAAEWAEQNLSAELLETDYSYRSSPAIIGFVNKIFSQENIKLSNFNLHQAVQSDLWGQVQVEPLITIKELDKSKTKTKVFRDPLFETKDDIENDCHRIEGLQIAKKILALIEDAIVITENSKARSIQYRDIMILARSRTHLPQLEQALRENQIPYSSTYDKDFLKTLEVQDILALLTYLIQSHNDLKLAQVLRSPLYAFSNEQLMQISIQPGATWHEKLKAYAETYDNKLAKQAIEQLQGWREIANTIPIHDLLDRIYFEANLLARYAISCANKSTGEINTHVLDNLTNLLQISLNIDAGRYSSIQSFLNALHQPTAMSSLSSDLPNLQDQDAVQIMTIHAAKGLEAPVVFLIDTGPQKSKPRTYQTIVNWSLNSNSPNNRPEQFFLLGRKDDIDRDTQMIIDQQTKKDRIEELNLLYVAVTRAKQYLFISGTNANNDKKSSWHSTIESGLSDDPEYSDQETWTSCFGTSPQSEKNVAKQDSEEFNEILELSKPFAKADNTDGDIQPQTAINEELADYGTLVHKVFELIEQQDTQEIQNLKFAVESSLRAKISSKEFENAVQEVTACLQSVEIKEIFEKQCGRESIKEVPISFIKNNTVLYRIIDHLIIDQNQAWIVDYKTDRNVNVDTINEHANQHLKQMSTYITAVKKLYPNKTIRASILFTSIPALYHFDTEKLL
jgi:ATP-dependent helicase/nuclease subunit A